jgi:ankyrin repeat protein
MNALRKGHVAAVKAALSNSSLNIRQVDEQGCTPLFLACGAKSNRVEIVCILLDAGSDVTTLSGSAGNSVLHYGLVSRPLDRVEKENGSSLGLIKVLLARSSSLATICNVNGDSPLAFACVNADADAIGYLLTFDGVPSQVHTANKAGVTALIVLSASEALEDLKYKSMLHLMKFLTKEDINFQSPVNGNSSLHAIVETGCSKCVMLLLSGGADIRLKNRAGKTPLDVARHLLEEMIKSRLQGSPAFHSAQQCVQTLESAWNAMEEHSRTLYEDLLGSIEKTTVGGGIQTGSKKKKKKKKKKSKSMVKQVADAPDNDNVGVTLSLDKKISAEEIAVGEIVGEKFEDVTEQDNVEGEAPTQVDVDVTKPVVSNSPSSIASVAPKFSWANVVAGQQNTRRSVTIESRTEEKASVDLSILRKQFDEKCALSKTLDLDISNALGLGMTDLSGAQIDALQEFHSAQIAQLRQLKFEYLNRLNMIGSVQNVDHTLPISVPPFASTQQSGRP